MKMFRRVLAIAVVLLLPMSVWAASATFEDVDRAKLTDGVWNGSDETGSIQSGSITFHNNYDINFKSWDGFSVSTKTDTKTPGFANQYSAITGKGVDGSATYGVGYFSAFAANAPELTFDTAQEISGFYFTNNTYAYLSMRDGDKFSKKFGGADGTDKDFLLVRVKAFAEDGSVIKVHTIYLADFRSDDSSKDYILNTWKWVDLSDLGKVKKLAFTFESSDTGDQGINTPTYICLDNVGGPRTSDDDDGDSDSSCFLQTLSR